MQAKQKMSKEPQITLETITPAVAAEYLKGNQSNRRLIYNHLNRLVSEMLAGEWRLTGDTIKLNGDRLLDGQHRLEAVVRSGVTIKCFVARNVDEDTFPMLDTGRTRIGGDVLSIAGYTNVFLTASVARVIWYFERKIDRLDGYVTNNAILLLMKRHPYLNNFVSDIQGHKFARTSSVVSSLYWLWCADHEKGDAFIDAFLKGVELKVSNPIYVLRERVINDRQLRSSRSTKTGRKALIAAFFRCWTAWLEGKTQSRLVINLPGEDFPWPAGAPYL